MFVVNVAKTWNSLQNPAFNLGQLGTEAMRRSIYTTVLFTLCLGCGPEFEVRKDRDLLRLDPKTVNRLQDIWIDSDYIPQVSDPATWKIHTSLADRHALNDSDVASVARSDDDHRISEWILIDLGTNCHFQNVQQLHPAGSGEPPRYRIDTADQRGFPFTLQYVGPGQPDVSTATFPRAVNARFIRVTVLEDTNKPWLITELRVN